MIKFTSVKITQQDLYIFAHGGREQKFLELIKN